MRKEANTRRWKTLDFGQEDQPQVKSKSGEQEDEQYKTVVRPPFWVPDKSKWREGRQLHIFGSTALDRNVRKYQSGVMSYFYYFGDSSQDMIAVRNKDQRALLLCKWHMRSPAFQLISIDDQIEILLDADAKARWSKSKYQRGEAANLQRRNTSQARIREAYDQYVQEHGRPPSRNALVNAAKCGPSSASKLLRFQGSLPAWFPGKYKLP